MYRQYSLFYVARFLHLERPPSVIVPKRERLLMAGAPIQAGMVFFPKGKSEDLKLQLTGFGSERFDDLVDAFSQGVNEIMNGMFDPYPEVIAV